MLAGLSAGGWELKAGLELERARRPWILLSSLAALPLSSAPPSTTVSKRPTRPPARIRTAQALDYYLMVLKSEPNNVYAANGLGAVLAEMGQLEEAKNIFNEVQVRKQGRRDAAESPLFSSLSSSSRFYLSLNLAVSHLLPPTPSLLCLLPHFFLQAAVASSDGFLHIPDLYINMANVALASQEYVDAQRLYKVAMTKLDTSKHSSVRRGGVVVVQREQEHPHCTRMHARTHTHTHTRTSSPLLPHNALAAHRSCSTWRAASTTPMTCSSRKSVS
jgi:hypothetical protein